MARTKRSAPPGVGPWTVFATKTQGLTPGFQIRDQEGNRYIIKLDPVDIPEISSAAEVIATKIFYALGYNTPENYITRSDLETVEIEPGTTWEDEFGDERSLTKTRIQRLLKFAPRLPDGRIRILASRYLPGLPLGPFRYFGTRSDDPNDVIPHEQRRELRGLRVFAAWLNHDDTRAQNTQDVWVAERGRHYVRHYLLDFGSTFGSGSVEMQLAHLGFHYWLDTGLLKRNALGFGLSTPAYRKVEWPPFPEYQSVGRWEAEHYEPHEWKNDYPNPAFVRMTDRDAFWAAKILMRLTPEELLAIVKTGEFTDPGQEAYFYDVLIKRQLKTGRFYINRVNPLDEFRITRTSLAFTNLSEHYGFVSPATRYWIRWSRYDNTTDTTTPLSEPIVQDEATIALPREARQLRQPGQFLLAEIHSLRDEHPTWNTRIGVYLRPAGDTFEIVGIERES